MVRTRVATRRQCVTPAISHIRIRPANPNNCHPRSIQSDHPRTQRNVEKLPLFSFSLSFFCLFFLFETAAPKQKKEIYLPPRKKDVRSTCSRRTGRCQGSRRAVRKGSPSRLGDPWVSRVAFPLTQAGGEGVKGHAEARRVVSLSPSLVYPRIVFVELCFVLFDCREAPSLLSLE